MGFFVYFSVHYGIFYSILVTEASKVLNNLTGWKIVRFLKNNLAVHTVA